MHSYKALELMRFEVFAIAWPKAHFDSPPKGPQCGNSICARLIVIRHLGEMATLCTPHLWLPDRKNDRKSVVYVQ